MSYEVNMGNYEIRLDANESFLDPGEEFQQEIRNVITQIPLNRYPDDSCIKLRKAFSSLYGVDSELVMAGNGSDELIGLIIGGLMKKGEKLLIFHPDFSMYSVFASTYGRELVSIPRREGYLLKSKDVLAGIEKTGARVVIFSNPASPLSQAMKREEVLNIVENTDVLVVVDEAYMDFSNQSILDMAGKYENLIILKTCSKALGCAALRLGFAISSKKMIQDLNNIRSPYNLNSLTQAIGCLILSKPDYIRRSINAIVQSRDQLYNKLQYLVQNRKINRIFPSETNFIYLETDYADWIFEELKKRSILIRKLDRSLRITAGTKMENERLIIALEEILNQSDRRGEES
ncbi:MAG: histidinol-phosphate transaminase [Eubacteriales bacterium]|nr:histidinol-phosphate transaminase [Eubacteriales bacterium]